MRRSSCPRSSISGRTAWTAERIDGGQLDALRPELDLAAADPRDVEQVVDQPRELPDLPLDDLAAPVLDVLGLRVHQELDGVGDRGQRIAQLMGQHGQELVLPPASSATWSSARRRSVTSRKTSTTPSTPPPAPGSGRRCRRSGRSVPSRAMSSVWLARPTTTPSASTRAAGLSTGCARLLVDDAEDLVERPADGLGRRSSRRATRPRGS